MIPFPTIRTNEALKPGYKSKVVTVYRDPDRNEVYRDEAVHEVTEILIECDQTKSCADYMKAVDELCELILGTIPNREAETALMKMVDASGGGDENLYSELATRTLERLRECGGKKAIDYVLKFKLLFYGSNFASDHFNCCERPVRERAQDLLEKEAGTDPELIGRILDSIPPDYRPGSSSISESWDDCGYYAWYRRLLSRRNPPPRP